MSGSLCIILWLVNTFAGNKTFRQEKFTSGFLVSAVLQLVYELRSNAEHSQTLDDVSWREERQAEACRNSVVVVEGVGAFAELIFAPEVFQ